MELAFIQIQERLLIELLVKAFSMFSQLCHVSVSLSHKLMAYKGFEEDRGGVELLNASGVLAILYVVWAWGSRIPKGFISVWPAIHICIKPAMMLV